MPRISANTKACRSRRSRIAPTLFTQETWALARKMWDDALSIGEVAGFRNAQTVVIAPTGCLTGDSHGRHRPRPDALESSWQCRWRQVARRRLPRPHRRRRPASDEVLHQRHRADAQDQDGERLYDPRDADAPHQGRRRDHRRARMEAHGRRRRRRCRRALDGLASSASRRRVTLPAARRGVLDRRLHDARAARNERRSRRTRSATSWATAPSTRRVCASAFRNRTPTSSSGSSRSAVHCSTSKRPSSQQTGYVEVAFHSVPLTLWWEACGFEKLPPTRRRTRGKGYTARVSRRGARHERSARIYGAFVAVSSKPTER